jgi:anti-anti-sigma factor
VAAHRGDEAHGDGPRHLRVARDPCDPRSEGAGTFDVVLRWELDGAVRVRVAGTMDIASVPRFEQFLSVLHEPGQRIQLDLRALSFIDVSGLRALDDAQRRAAAGGWTVEIVAVTWEASRLMRLAGLGHLVPSLG